MKTAVLATLALLLVTKLADCASTLARIGDARQETNPRASRLMARCGIRTVVWGYGALAAGIAIASALPALVADAPWYAAGYVALGLTIALVQADVARSNWTGRSGPIARWVAAWHGRVARR